MIKEKTILSRILSKLENIEGEISGMKKDIKDTKGDVSVMKVDMNGMKGDISNMKGKINGMKGEMSDMKGEMSNMKGEIKGLKGEMNEMKGSFKREIKIAVKELEERIDKKMEDRFESFAIMVKRGFDEVYKRIDNVLKRVVSVEKKEKQNSKRILFVENDLRSLDSGHNRILKRVASLEAK